MAAEAMLNKNRMMVFKNKGKDQEVSESSLPLYAEAIEFLARWKLFTGESRRSRVRRPARCHFSPNSYVRSYVRTAPLFPPHFSLSLFHPYHFLLSLFISFLHLSSFFSFFRLPHILPLQFYPFTFFPFPSLLLFF